MNFIEQSINTLEKDLKMVQETDIKKSIEMLNEDHYCPQCDNLVDINNPKTKKYCGDYFCNAECEDDYAWNMK